MDKTNYRSSMMLETVFLTILTSTLPVTAILGKAFFPLWIWLIYFTFPGTYATQPAVTTQTFGHKYGGTIYGFLFTSDIINNLLVGVLSKAVLDAGGWVGFFLVLACFSVFAFGITCVFPSSPHLVSASVPRPVVTKVEAEEALVIKDTREVQNLDEDIL